MSSIHNQNDQNLIKYALLVISVKNFTPRSCDDHVREDVSKMACFLLHITPKIVFILLLLKQR